MPAWASWSNLPAMPACARCTRTASSRRSPGSRRSRKCCASPRTPDRMPLYRYKALNTRGEMLDGQMEAANDAEVALRLQEQGHLPVEAKLASEGGGESAWRALLKPKPFAGQRLVQFTQQLATLLGAGQPLDRALTIPVSYTHLRA